MDKAPFKRRLKWQCGDVFAVPLTDGTYGFAQALAPVQEFAIDFALLSTRASGVELPSEWSATVHVAGLMATWRNAVTGGHWCFVGPHAPLTPPEASPNQIVIASGSIRTSHASWGLLEKFLSAYHGLFPWNLFPAFDFDSYLMPGASRPPGVILLAPDQVALAASEMNRSGYAA